MVAMMDADPLVDEAIAIRTTAPSSALLRSLSILMNRVRRRGKL